MIPITKQLVYCRSCGKQFSTDFREYAGEVCGRKCWEDLEWIKVLAMMGKPYRPRSITCEHKTVRYTSDPSGGYDCGYTCEDCQEEVTRTDWDRSDLQLIGHHRFENKK